jgi:nucleoside 2-deoxyribosyltransferase
MGEITGNPDDYPVHTEVERQLTGRRGITRRDHNDCISADALVVNLLGAKIVSIGTMFELAWAYDRQIPVILVMEEYGNIHEHAMLEELYTYRVTSLDAACFLTRTLLLPDQGPTSTI